MKSRIQILLVLFAFTICTTANAQDENKNVSITVSGSGKSLDDAKQSALRSAIEQAFGAFISSKTEIFNDQIVADQMSSVSSGNIQSYEMLNESQLPDGTWGVTLKALVSISKLTNFVEAKGIAIEIKGGMFALNIRQQLLNEQGEIKAVCEMVGLLHEPMQISFDYVIKSSDPKSMDAESKNWEIPLVVTATTNKNIDFCANYCIKTLAALSLTTAEVESYKSLNKVVFPVTIIYPGPSHTFYLRKQTSINALNILISQWEFYVRGFSVQSGMNQSENNSTEQRMHDFTGSRFNPSNSSYKKDTYIWFLTTGDVAGTFSWNDQRTLAQIDSLTGYSVKPLGVRSQFKHGGIVVYEKDGHGLVAALADMGYFNWADAKIACDDLVLNGYDDWHLPTIKELTALYVNLKTRGIGGFVNYAGWSSMEYDAANAYYFDFGHGKAGNLKKTLSTSARAVRAF